jgi:hypothetical protein
MGKPALEPGPDASREADGRRLVAARPNVHVRGGAALTYARL